MADVFISYGRSDQAVARRVAKAFESAGLDVWWDADLPAHRAYSEVIERNLEAAKAVVVLWSGASAKSQWVRAEADVARNAGKLVQAQLDGTIPPLPFNQIQCADLKGWRGGASHAGWSKLQGSVQALVSGEEPARSPVSEVRPWERLQPYRWWALAALLLFVAAAGFYAWQGGIGEEKKPVVAVLPFRSLEARDESLVAGIWEDTRSAIGRNPQLVVLGPNTAQELAEKGAAAADRAADYIVQASVRSAGDRIRVNADLVRTRDDAQVWSQSFDRKLDDVFALQTEIAREIEGRIRGRLAEKGGKTPEHISTSGDAYALYTAARAKIRRREFEGYAEIRDQLVQVLRIDPNYAPAWAALSQIGGQIRASQNKWTTENNSEAYARKAIELAPNLATGHAALAFSLQLVGPVARAELEKAVALDPNDYEAWLWLGNLRNGERDRKGAIEAYRRAMRIEPLFWPAVLNLYDALELAGDQAGMRELIAEQERIGAHHLATSIRIEQALARNDIAGAANLGLAFIKTGSDEGKAAIGAVVWATLLQLGFQDEAVRISPAPHFAPLLWKNDPKGLDMLEAEGVQPRAFFIYSPLTENAGRVYLLSGRSRKVADMYRSLNMSPAEVQELMKDNGHFLDSAPLIALALRENGAGKQAADLLAQAETTGKEELRSGEPAVSAQLARVYAVQGRKEEALSMLSAAVSRGWLPQPPVVLTDLMLDPALASLKGDQRFKRIRQQVLATIARERARIDPRLLPQGKAA